MIITLLKSNLQWYQQVMSHVLFRYKLFLFLSVCLLFPNLSSAAQMALFPFNAFLSGPGGHFMHFVYVLFGIQVSSSLWLMLHQPIVANRPWHRWMSTLPFLNYQRVFFNYSHLLIINMAWWTGLLAAGILRLTSATSFSMWFCLEIIAKSLLFVLFILASQACSMRGWVFLQKKIKYWTLFHGRYSFLEKHALLTIHLKDCMRHVAQHNLTLLMLGAVTGCALFCAKTGGQYSVASKILFIMMLVNVVSASSVFSVLHERWQNYHFFLGSLPLSFIRLMGIRWLVVGTVVALFNAVILFAVFLWAPLFVERLSLAFLLSLILLCPVYFLQIKLRRYGTLMSLMLMIGLVSVGMVI